MSVVDEWTTVIGARRPWFDLRLRELFEARDLILLLVRRDFAALYKQTILGPIWFLLQPLLTTLMFTLVFGRLARLPSDGVPPFLFYLAGTVTWTYFAACLTKTADTFAANAALFGKVYFPRLAVPVSILLSNLVTFAIQSALLVVFVAYFWWTGAAVRPTAALVLVPVLLVLMAGLGLGLGIVVASLTTRYRDLHYLVAFGTQLLMFATPVIYPMSAVPAELRFWMRLNPMAPIVESLRYAVLGAGTVSAGSLLYSAACMLVVLLAGVVLFTRIEQTFMDTV